MPALLICVADLCVLLAPLRSDTIFTTALQFARAAQSLTAGEDEGGLVDGNQVGY